ncbi:MAG: tRNA (adenosine(37)-N6)-threonylcarbamoyltransferase complex ATPase subunit type 1 TsaE [Saprospiraceae bacterium]|nr:tRNA (adenosine(37)-N6)-threonylcarbamoyltransferase complex ATPase subunit type 1 TsaE [Bacteroidia bacterium]MBT8230656.1 tRNA (adenosine(37)-N6)-threonylcarbamoyltransferase complex ATPase subunit type 1 TsaE [Bacteroidia bacterium]NNF23053.1 tRNA (adenosine(37)-N6)-threonylcarbamoyltransferase complex ATPase subunit type 1 TsaE [Saprospiraceae bacterium]
MIKAHQTYLVEDLDQLASVALKLAKDIEHPLILFIGELGAGKTTIIKELIKLDGSEDSGSSPSFSIINEYKTGSCKSFHLDLYRLNTAEEAFQLGIEEIIYSGDKCYVEWPQIIMDYIDEPFHIIRIELIENNKRKISIV